MSIPRIVEVPAGKVPPEMRKMMEERRKLVEKMARQKLAEKMREKRRGPKATTNPPKRGDYGQAERRPSGPPVWEGFPKKPTRLPRWENMPQKRGM